MSTPTTTAAGYGQTASVGALESEPSGEDGTAKAKVGWVSMDEGVGANGTKKKVLGFSSYDSGTISVVVKELSVDKGLELVLAEKYITKRTGVMKWCYKQQLQVAPTLEATITFTMTISETGKVEHVGVVESKAELLGLETCLTSKLERFMFPARGTKATVTFTLELPSDPI